MIRPIFSYVSGDLEKSSSYINKIGGNPNRLTIIYWKDIVFTKSELVEDNWLYVGKDIEYVKQRQILEANDNKVFRDGPTPVIPIFE
jgi:hypothetical protein